MNDSKVAEIMAKVQSGELSIEEATKLISSTSQRKLTVKVNPKGTISVYGHQRFPTSLYPEQWDRLLNIADDIRSKFNEANENIKTYVPPKEEKSAS